LLSRAPLLNLFSQLHLATASKCHDRTPRRQSDAAVLPHLAGSCGFRGCAVAAERCLARPRNHSRFLRFLCHAARSRQQRHPARRPADRFRRDASSGSFRETPALFGPHLLQPAVDSRSACWPFSPPTRELGQRHRCLHARCRDLIRSSRGKPIASPPPPASQLPLSPSAPASPFPVNEYFLRTSFGMASERAGLKPLRR
jgi:hypothetical protein